MPGDAAGPGGAPTPAAGAHPARASSGEPSGRRLVVVIDDLTLSPESMRRTREALTNLVDTSLLPGDRVALLRTSGGLGAAQQFTGDKAVLRERIERLRFNSRQFERDDYTLVAEKEFAREWPPLRNPYIDMEAPPSEFDQRHAANEEHLAAGAAFSAGVVGTLQGVVEGLRAIPGRKGVLLFSDGFTLTGGKSDRVLPMLEQALQRIVDQAARSHTVIYAINARPWEWMAGADRELGGNPFRTDVDGTMQHDRAASLRTMQYDRNAEGPSYLATETGGYFFRNPSDLSIAVRQSIDDQRGYYLLGYTPDAKTAEQDKQSRTFHRIAVRVRGRSGLTVRSRKGFLGGREAGLLGSGPAGTAGSGGALATAAVSPFAASTLDLRLTGFFAGQDGDQSIVRTLVYVNAASLEFQQGARGKPGETYLEVLTLLLDERGSPVKRDQQSYRVRRGDDVRAQGGFIYRLDVPVKAPGPYSVRVAAREVASNKVGSASQFVIVPDLTRKRLALSGVLLSGSDATTAPTSGPAESAHPAVRRFKVPADLAYAFQIYNAQYGDGSSTPELHARVRLLRDGRVVYTGPTARVQTGAARGTPVNAVGSLSVGRQTSPGEYTLAVTVTDALASKEHADATATIDFTIEP
jgi:VWFA-related protein